MFCDHLEGWDREGARETQEGGDMGTYVCICLIHIGIVLYQYCVAIITQYCEAIILQQRSIKKKDKMI